MAVKIGCMQTINAAVPAPTPVDMATQAPPK